MENKKLKENLERSSKMPAEKMKPSTLKLSFAEDKCHFRYILLQSLKIAKIKLTLPISELESSLKERAGSGCCLNSYD